MRFIAVFLLIFSSSCFAADGDLPQAQTAQVVTETHPTPDAPVDASAAFAQGIAAFRKNDFATARTAFRASLAKDPSQVAAWFNLGVSEQRLGNKGAAMAYLRKALALMPGFQPARDALAYTRKTLDKSDIPHDVETWESLRNTVLVSASIHQFSLLTLILFFLTAWLALIYVGQRRRARLDEKPMPAFPILASVTGALFASCLALSICKLIDDQDVRGTVLTKKIEARALPDTTSTTLFELYEGLEVIVQQSRQGWVQVTYPGGATGWIPRAALFTTADRIAP